MPPKKAGTKRKAAKAKIRDEADTMSHDEAFKQAFYTDTDSSNDDAPGGINKRGQLRRKRGRRPKRPKTSAPPSIGISDHEMMVGDSSEEGQSIAKNLRVMFTDDFDGPQLKISLADILANSGTSLDSLLHAAGLEFTIARGRGKISGVKPASFADLPFEVSVQIYRTIFVSPAQPIMFTERTGFQRSAQILRTCRKVHADGTAVLYGENSFHFSRAHKNRGTYFEAEWKEIGYKDVRRFFNDIGPHNMAKLKYVSFEFEDALPTYAPRLDWEARKYFNDAVLLEVIEMVAKHTKLEKLYIGFRGKCNLSDKDYHLLKALCSIRCHEFSKDFGICLQRVNTETYAKIKRLTEIPAKINDKDVDKSKKKHVPRMFRDH